MKLRDTSLDTGFLLPTGMNFILTKSQAAVLVENGRETEAVLQPATCLAATKVDTQTGHIREWVSVPMESQPTE